MKYEKSRALNSQSKAVERTTFTIFVANYSKSNTRLIKPVQNNNWFNNWRKCLQDFFIRKSVTECERLLRYKKKKVDYRIKKKRKISTEKHKAQNKRILIRNCPSPSGYGNRKSLVITSFVKITPENVIMSNKH